MLIALNRDSIISEKADPDTFTLEWVEDEALLYNATSQQIRLQVFPDIAPSQSVA